MRPNLVISSVVFFLYLSALNEVDARVTAPLPAGESPYVCKVEKYEPCKEYPNTQVQFHNTSIDRVNIDVYRVNCTICVTEKMHGPLYMGAKVESCTDTSCRHEIDQTFQDLCEDVKNKNSHGYDVMANKMSFKEPKCPLDEGCHDISSEVDAKTFMLMGGKAKTWKMNLMFLDSKKTVKSCIHFKLNMVPKQGIKNKQNNFKTVTG